MPLAEIKINDNLSEISKKNVVTGVSKIISQEIGKPETYVMVTLNCDTVICMSGDSEKKSAFINVKSIGGLNSETNRNISKKICDFLSSEFNIDSSRIYINFTNKNASEWGWNSSTFG